MAGPLKLCAESGCTEVLQVGRRRARMEFAGIIEKRILLCRRTGKCTLFRFLSGPAVKVISLGFRSAGSAGARKGEFPE